jgi:hypothetical protein
MMALPPMALPALPAKKPAPPKKGPAAVAPNDIPHATAMLLTGLSNDGKRRVTFKATALGRHFFFEEASGVTVYTYDGVLYRKTTFLKGSTLEAAVRRYAKADAAKSRK